MLRTRRSFPSTGSRARSTWVLTFSFFSVQCECPTCTSTGCLFLSHGNRSRLFFFSFTFSYIVHSTRSTRTKYSYIPTKKAMTRWFDFGSSWLRYDRSPLLALRLSPPDLTSYPLVLHIWSWVYSVLKGCDNSRIYHLWIFALFHVLTVWTCFTSVSPWGLFFRIRASSPVL